jgi:predicted nucleic acid-binding protein
MTTAIAENTVLSNFAHIEKPELLRAAFDSLVVVKAFMDELAEGVRLGLVPLVDWGWLPTVELTAEEQAKAEELGQTLGKGEAACIALAQSRGWMVLTDDRDARETARDVGVALSGTLGALMNLVRANVLSIPDGDELLNQMKQHGYRCPINSLAELDDE